MLKNSILKIIHPVLIKTRINFLCFVFIAATIPALVYANNPISPNSMAELMGIGLSTSWARNANQAANYSTLLVDKIAAAGFGHIRFRVSDPVSTLTTYLDKQVDDCLNSGMVAVIACDQWIGFEWETNPTEENRHILTDWWEDVANHYKDYTHKLVFNLTVELKGVQTVSQDNGTYLNDFIEEAVTKIRNTGGNNTTRIIIMQPQRRGDPYRLERLKIPTNANGYMMAEWHDGYASGPKPEIWHDPPTAADKELITNRIAAALAWTEETGIPTYEGAWMPGNYNKGNDFTVPQQIEFIDFFAGELAKAGIPSCVNATHQFIDNDTKEWISSLITVRDKMIDVYADFDSNYTSLTSLSDDTFKIYPNPTTGLINLNLNTIETGIVSIVNMFGATVKTMELKNQLDISELNSGFYYLVISNKNQIITKAVIKK